MAAVDGEGLASSISGKIRIRDDLDVSVLVFSTETDLILLGEMARRVAATSCAAKHRRVICARACC